MAEPTLVVIRTYLKNIDAEMAASALEAAGILAVIRADDCGGVRPHLWMGGIALLVQSDVVEDATAVLDIPAVREARKP